MPPIVTSEQGSERPEMKLRFLITELDLQPSVECIHRSWNQRWGLGEAAAARAAHSASRPGDRGLQVIEPTWNQGRFTYP